MLIGVARKGPGNKESGFLLDIPANGSMKT